jgi:hypothetical protein
MNLSHVSLAALSLWTLSSGTALAGGVIQVDDDKSINIGLLLQPQLQMAQVLDANGDTDYYSFDPFVRRTRILMGGQFTKWVNFFVDTDNPNLGMGGFTSTTYIQDAWVEANIAPYLQIDAGLLLLPFSHQGIQSAGALHTMDYHGALMKYPTGSHLVWRDTGIQFRGLVAKKKLEYRLAITNGLDSDNLYNTGTVMMNEKDKPRFVGRLQVNAMEAEGGPGAKGYFYKGINIEKEGKKIKNNKKVLSFGGSFDFQPDASIDGNGELTNYMAMAGDVILDMPIGGKAQGVTAQANVYNYNYGEKNANTAMGVAFEAGYRMNAVEPLVIFDMWNVKGDPDADDVVNEAGDMTTVAFGLNWWALAHNANLKLQIGATQKKDGTDAEDKYLLTSALQGQLLF